MTGLRGFRQRNGNVGTVLILIAAAFIFLPSLFFRWLFIDLQSVTVNEDLQVVVKREIQRNFLGAFSATLRDADTDKIICFGEVSQPFEYKERAGKTNPIAFNFRQWASLEDRIALYACMRNGFLSGGRFYITTCHTAYFPNGWKIGGRCVSSNVFQPTAAAIKKLLED